MQRPSTDEAASTGGAPGGGGGGGPVGEGRSEGEWGGGGGGGGGGEGGGERAAPTAWGLRPYPQNVSCEGGGGFALYPTPYSSLLPISYPLLRTVYSLLPPL